MAERVIVGSIRSHNGYTSDKYDAWRTYTQLIFEEDSGETIVCPRIKVHQSVFPAMFPGTSGRFFLEKLLLLRTVTAAEINGVVYGHMSKEKREKYGFSTAKQNKF